jgi:hypothetical protein
MHAAGLVLRHDQALAWQTPAEYRIAKRGASVAVAA